MKYIFVSSFFFSILQYWSINLYLFNKWFIIFIFFKSNFLNFIMFIKLIYIQACISDKSKITQTNWTCWNNLITEKEVLSIH